MKSVKAVLERLFLMFPMAAFLKVKRGESLVVLIGSQTHLYNWLRKPDAGMLW